LSRVGQRFDSSDESAGSRMGAFSLLALFASWELSPQWAVEARLNNATDKRYQTAQGYAVPGREGQVTLRWAPAW
jgi:vitamin B12 transporter